MEIRIINIREISSSFVCIYLTIVICFVKNNNGDDLTQILYKKDYKGELNNHPQPMFLGDNGFQSFISQHDNLIWVDKSGLINSIINGPKVTIITSPRRWGKTLNLGMMCHFFGAEFYENKSIKPYKETWAYNYFSEGKVFTDDGIIYELNKKPIISKNRNAIDKHLGRYPIIYMDFKDCPYQQCTKWPTSSCIFDEIRENYRLYDYIMKKNYYKVNDADASLEDKRLAQKQIDRYQRILNDDEYNLNLMKKAILELCQIVKEYHNVAPMILIDEFDSPINSLFKCRDKTKRQEIVDFYRTFIAQTFKASEYKSKSFHRGIMTGILRIAESTTVSGLNNVLQCNFIEKDSLIPFYGFSHDEVAELMKMRAINADLQTDAILLYDGYRSLRNLSCSMYSPISVCKFINTKILGTYWTKTSEIISPLFECLNDNEHLHHLEILLNEMPYKISYNNIIFLSYDEHIDPLIEIIQTKQKLEEDKIGIVIGMLTMLGYFTPENNEDNRILATREDSINNLGTNILYLRIPDLEIKNYISSYVVKAKIVQLSKHTLVREIDYVNAGEYLDDYLKYRTDETFRNFRSTVERIFKNTGPLVDLRKKINCNDPYVRGFMHSNKQSVETIVTPIFLLLMEQGYQYWGEKTFSITRFQNNPNVSTKKDQEKRKRIDIFMHNFKQAIIVELKYGPSTSEENALIQTLSYATEFRDTNRTFIETIFFTIHAQNESSIELFVTIKTQKEIDTFLNQTIELEKHDVPLKNYTKITLNYTIINETVVMPMNKASNLTYLFTQFNISEYIPIFMFFEVNNTLSLSKLSPKALMDIGVHKRAFVVIRSIISGLRSRETKLRTAKHVSSQKIDRSSQKTTITHDIQKEGRTGASGPFVDPLDHGS